MNSVIVSVDPKIIPNHSDIETQAFLTVLREFILAVGDHGTEP